MCNVRSFSRRSQEQTVPQLSHHNYYSVVFHSNSHIGLIESSYDHISENNGGGGVGMIVTRSLIFRVRSIDAIPE